MGSVSSSLPKDHVIGVTIEQVRSEPGNQSINLYKAVPSLPLLPGEYCLICNRVLYFDFGMDPNGKVITLTEIGCASVVPFT